MGGAWCCSRTYRKVRQGQGQCQTRVSMAELCEATSLHTPCCTTFLSQVPSVWTALWCVDSQQGEDEGVPCTLPTIRTASLYPPSAASSFCCPWHSMHNGCLNPCPWPTCASAPELAGDAAAAAVRSPVSQCAGQRQGVLPQAPAGQHEAKVSLIWCAQAHAFQVVKMCGQFCYVRGVALP